MRYKPQSLDYEINMISYVKDNIQEESINHK
jgi:hypothetical protein